MASSQNNEEHTVKVWGFAPQGRPSKPIQIKFSMQA